MAETSPVTNETIVENASAAPVTIEKEEAKPQTPVESEEAKPLPKRKGRPPGAKDKVPRKKTVTIVEEPITASKPIEAAAPAVKPMQQVAEAAKPPEPPELERHYEPPSPRSMIRYHSAALFHAKTLQQEDRKRRIHESIFNSLHVLD
jgi:hypothetical protein